MSNEQEEKVKYCLYARKSTESDEKQALSIDAQIREMAEIAHKEGLEIVDIKRESHSAKATGCRPVFNKMIQGIQSGRYSGILTWAPDRISRNAGDLGIVVDLFDEKKLIEIRTYSQSFRNNPNEKFLLMILGSQAKLENDQKGLNVKRGLKARLEMGLWPAPAPTGYFNHPDRSMKCHVVIDSKRAPVIREMFEKVGNENWTGRQLFKWLKDTKKFKTSGAKHLTLSNVYIILSNHFYYGTCNYPKNSDNYYQGKHEPIVSKELFDKVQDVIKGRSVPKSESKEFAFTKLMKCGMCQSGITADEKFKRLQGGGVNRHVYYFCTKARDIDCKNKTINETDLIKSFQEMIDEVELREGEVMEKIREEVNRYNKFRTGVLGQEKEKIEVAEQDVRHYMKYLLHEGTIIEKRDVLGSIDEQLILVDKKIYLQGKLF